MKRIAFNIIVLISIISSSCQKEEDLDNSIIGSWQMFSWTSDGLFDLNEDNIYNNDMLKEFKEVMDCYEYKYVFNENGSFRKENILKTTFYDEFGQVHLILDCEPYVLSGVWEMDNSQKKLHLEISGMILNPDFRYWDISTWVTRPYDIDISGGVLTIFNYAYIDKKFTNDKRSDATANANFRRLK
jgi:hypothetical protein